MMTPPGFRGRFSRSLAWPATWGLLACGPVVSDAPGSSSDDSGGETLAAASSAALDDGGGTGDAMGDGATETGGAPPELRCDEVPTVLSNARWWTAAEYPAEAPGRAHAAVTGGSAVLLRDETLVWIDAAGELGAPLELAGSEHPTALASTSGGSVLVAGYRSAGVSGEVDAYIREYDVSGAPGTETSWSLERGANESPLAIAVSPDGTMAVLTQVTFDATMPAAVGFMRLDVFDSTLQVAWSLELEDDVADLTIDDAGNTYLAAQSDAAITLVGFDPSGDVILQEQEPSEGGSIALAAGAHAVYEAQASSEAFGGGMLRARSRLTGEVEWSHRFEATSLAELIETPIDAAASPCGGVYLVTEARYDGDTHVALSYFSDDGTRGELTTPEDPPVAGAHYTDVLAIDVAFDGTIVVSGQLGGTSDPLVWLSRY